MKTPKRIAYCSCGCWLNLESGDYMDDKGKSHKCAALFCPKCGAEYRGEAFAARIIRKNREKRLKHKIAVLDGDVKYNMECVRFWRKKCKRLLEYQETSTYGQEVEGS